MGLRAVPQRGFTLIEMLVTLAIIGILSGVVIARFNAFDSTVLLKAAAYDIAATLREAQVYSVSVLGRNNQFDTPYGVTFTPNTQEYQLFRFIDPSVPQDFPQYGVAEAQDVIGPAQLQRSIAIRDICLRRDTGTEHCYSDDVSGNTLSRLDISFRRPEFKALFHVEGLPPGVVNPTNGSNGNIESVRIELESQREPGNVFAVNIGLLGHISVEQIAP